MPYPQRGSITDTNEVFELQGRNIVLGLEEHRLEAVVKGSSVLTNGK